MYGAISDFVFGRNQVYNSGSGSNVKLLH